MVRLDILALSLAVSFATAQRFNTTGTIQVYNTTNWREDVPESARLGCLSSSGRLTPNDCGKFQQMQDYPWTLYTLAGNCSFEDSNEPLNSDSLYGRSDHAFHCYSTPAKIQDSMYYLGGLSPHKYLCIGDRACYFDTKITPTSGDRIPIWVFRWGANGGLGPGHTMLGLRWVDV